MGPVISAACKMDDDQATALGKSPAFTSCGMKACPVGILNARTTPFSSSTP
jgi:hypothetical protein